MENTLADTVLETFIQTFRSVVGAERFDSATPDQTLQPGSTARQHPADVATIQIAHGNAGGARPGYSEAPKTILAPSNGTSETEVSFAPLPGNFACASEYTLRERIGKGGMGEIHLAGQNGLRREVAVKKILPELRSNNDARKIEDAFVSEALITGFLDHPNIVPVHALGRDEDGNWFFAMKMVRGIEWRHLLHPDKCKDAVTKERARTRNLDIDDPARRAAHLVENLRILLSVCNAAAFAHSKSIIHRDLKPENVMVGAFGEVLAMDWGLAVDVSEAPPPPGHPDRRVPSREETGVGGTATYMAPEQFFFDGNGQPRGTQLGLQTDVFLLGATLYELLSGHAPHRGESISAVLRKVSECAPPPLPDDAPSELVAICRKALSKNRGDRYADALAFQKALQEFLAHREAAAIADIADHEAKTLEIPNLARAVVLYDQALKLWPECAAMAARVNSARASLARKENRARWMHRSLIGAVASIVIGLTAGFFLVRAERQEALAQKLEAEKQKQEALAAQQLARKRLAQGENARDAAQNLVNQAILGLREKLAAVGKVVVLEEVANAAEEYYSKLPVELSTETTFRHRGSLAQNRGLIAIAVGDDETAETALKKALVIARDLSAAYPTNVALIEDQCNTYGLLSGLYYEQDRMDEAVACGTTVLKLADHCQAVAPDSVEALRGRVLGSTIQFTMSAKSGRALTTSLPLLMQCKTSAARLKECVGETFETRMVDGMMQFAQGFLAVKLGNAENAMKLFDEADVVFNTAVEMSSGHPYGRQMMLLARKRAAEQLRNISASTKNQALADEADRRMQAILSAWEKMTESEPSRRDWWLKLGWIYDDCATIAIRANNKASELQYIEKSVAAVEHAVSPRFNRKGVRYARGHFRRRLIDWLSENRPVGWETRALELAANGFDILISPTQLPGWNEGDAFIANELLKRWCSVICEFDSPARAGETLKEFHALTAAAERFIAAMSDTPKPRLWAAETALRIETFLRESGRPGAAEFAAHRKRWLDDAQQLFPDRLK